MIGIDNTQGVFHKIFKNYYDRLNQMDEMDHLFQAKAILAINGDGKKNS